MGISLDEAELLALFLETSVYGIFFTLFLITFTILSSARLGRAHSRTIILPTAFFMLALATAHLIIDYIRAAHAFIVLGAPSGAASEFFSDISEGTFLAKSLLYLFQTLTGDSIIIWRCYIVTNSQPLLIVFPLIALIGDIVSGFIIIARIAQAPSDAFIFTILRKSYTAYTSMTVAITIYCTAAISWRIYQPSRDSRKLRPVLVAIIESGALYTVTVLTSLVLFLTTSYAQFAILDLLMPLVGVVYCLIILQIRYQTYHVDNAANTSELRCTHQNGDGRRRIYSSIRFWHQTDRGDGSGNMWNVTEDEESGRSVQVGVNLGRNKRREQDEEATGTSESRPENPIMEERRQGVGTA